ncbi:MAG: TetR/AcrR family transcriptional regulator [Alphaproteobacteria bacterium]|jgi:TetR/AcrR family transcriptional repressor of nem operon|nr:TetR/AcrR family transcriptional regulator [Alphaproteobacteria bacterium]MDP6517620.1 TetR/AcrR family transcriptional regulator [Alphaproteobacteria bacterium]
MPWEKQFDVSEALGRAMEAFWSRGYEATSTQNLLDEMGINRGSLYDTFGNKRSLFLKALKRYEATYQRPRIAAAARGRTAPETIRRLFDSLVSDVFADSARGDCFLVNTALEMAAHDPEVAAIVGEGFRDIESFFRSTIERGLAAGDIGAHVDATEVARALLGLLIGLRVLARSLPDRALLESIAGRAAALIE